MITVRPSAERGHFNNGWLDPHHTFSFADYFDPKNMGFRALRVINEDRVAPGSGFGTHPHRDMEIITYVLEGALAHKDSMGNGSTIVPGDVQRMSAGTGVRHSEFNHSPSDPVHLLQIWILPEKAGITPSYEQKNFPAEEKRDRLRLVASQDGRQGSLKIHQDVNLYAALLEKDKGTRFDVAPGRNVWVQVTRGEISVNGNVLKAGDGAAIGNEPAIDFTGNTGPDASEFLLFDLA